MTRTRRRLLLGIAPALLGLPCHVQSQPVRRLPQVAYIWMFGYGPSAPYPDAFKARLRELGWRDGQNITLSFHDAGGVPQELARIVDGVVADKVDVIFAMCTPEARAARKATTTIPIVMAATGDPVAAGLVKSMARPDTNVTGVSTLSLELSAKRVALLKEAAPRIAQAAVIWNPDRPDNHGEVAAMRKAAASLGVRTRSAEVRSREELTTELEALASDGTQSVLNCGDSLVSSSSQQIVSQCNRLRLPAMFEDRIFPEAGGLMSYGPNLRQMHAFAADYVDKILRGAKPGELPIAQPTHFELVLNARTAKSIGMTFPRNVLLQADQVIE